MYAKWQMEYHLGWVTILADVITKMVDGIATGQFLFILFLISEVLNRTSNQMFGRWYLPMFLFRDGSLTHWPQIHIL